MQDIEELLQATAHATGHELAGHRFIDENVYGEGVIRSYELTLRSEHGAQLSQVVYLQSSPKRVEADGIIVFRDEESGDEVAVWLYPSDPELPALPVAVFPDAARTLLQRMGLPFDAVSLQLVAYRPGKRAVVRAESPTGTVWLKVVRPTAVAPLHRLYRVWETANLPVPQTLGWSEEGIIGFTHLPGVPATSVVEHLDDRFLSAVEQLTVRYGAVASPDPARASLANSHAWYARKASERNPDHAATIHAISERVQTLLGGAATPNTVTVHGDLHLGQIFVSPEDPGTITGILDIDTAGFGDPADDAAAMYAHLVVSRYFERDPRSRRALTFERLAADWRRRFLATQVGDGDAEARFTAIAATHLIAHSLGNLVPAHHLIEDASALVER